MVPGGVHLSPLPNVTWKPSRSSCELSTTIVSFVNAPSSRPTMIVSRSALPLTLRSPSLTQPLESQRSALADSATNSSDMNVNNETVSVRMAPRLQSRVRHSSGNGGSHLLRTVNGAECPLTFLRECLMRRARDMHRVGVCVSSSFPHSQQWLSRADVPAKAVIAARSR